MDTATPRSTFVGRQRELEALGARLRAAAAGEGSLVLLGGEPGIGKTSLTRAFVASSAAQGAVVLWGSCFEGDLSRPYGPWVEALGAYAEATEPARLHAQLGPGAPPLADVVPQVRAALPVTAPAAPLDPDDARFRLYDAVVQWLLAIARERTLVLVLDDLHWADADSLRLLRYVARGVARARVLLVGLYRHTELGLHRGDLQRGVAGQGTATALQFTDVLAMVQRDIPCERMTLSGLSLADVSDYLARAAAQQVPAALVGAIYAETGGNPFFTHELFRHLLEQGTLIRHDGRWTADLTAFAAGIPESVREVLHHRMALLLPQTRRLLQLASACTSGFSFALLQALGGVSDELGLACIDEALHAGLIRPVGPAYDFAHAIVRHTLYEALNPDRRARLHRQIAAALAQACTGREPHVAAEIAAHYHASAALPGAEQGIPYGLAAAEQARARHAHEQAVTLLRLARDLAASFPVAERVEILCRLAITEAEALRLTDAQRTVQDVLDARPAQGEQSAEDGALAAFLATAARALKDGGAPHGAWGPLAERGLALLGPQRDLTWARLMLLRDRFEPVSQGTITASRWLGYEPTAVAIARDRGDEDDDAQTLEPFQWRSRQETDAILARARRWTRPSAIMRALDVAARDLVFRHAAFADGAAAFEELLAHGERYGSIPAQAEALVQLASCQAALGELERAARTQERAQDMVDRLGAEHRLRTIVGVMNGTLLAYYLEGDWPGLAVAAARFLAGGAVTRTPHGLLAASFLALAQARAGNPAGARATLGTLTPVLARSHPRTFMHNGAVSGAAAAVWELGVTDPAEAYERMARALADAGVGGMYLSADELTVARMRALAGDIGQASEFFARARRTLEATGQRPLRAIADHDEALALLRAGAGREPRVAALLDAAQAAFDALGMVGWRERVGACRAMLERDGPAAPGYPAALTAREVEVLRLVAGGKTNREIAAELVVSVHTVERHVANIYGKIDARGRADATAYALRHGLLPAQPQRAGWGASVPLPRSTPR